MKEVGNIACGREQSLRPCYLSHPVPLRVLVYGGRGVSSHPSKFGVLQKNCLWSLGFDSDLEQRSASWKKLIKTSTLLTWRPGVWKAEIALGMLPPNVRVLWGVKTVSHYIPSIHMWRFAEGKGLAGYPRRARSRRPIERGPVMMETGKRRFHDFTFRGCSPSLRIRTKGIRSAPLFWELTKQLTRVSGSQSPCSHPLWGYQIARHWIEEQPRPKEWDSCHHSYLSV